MTLHLVYRSSGKENNKRRPPFYSKTLALASFLRAVERSDEVGSVVFLNDAPIPRATVEMMSKAGEVVNRTGLTLARSYREAITLPLQRRWPSSDLVYLSEDDYLFRPQAFTSLIRAAHDIPEAAYFAFYATIAPGGRRLATATGDWRVAESTTSSFGARISLLAADRWLHMLGSRAEADFDRAICTAYSGLRPYGWHEVLSGAGASPGLKPTAARVVARTTLNLGSHLARRRRRLLVAALPSLATHMEELHMAKGVDWAEVASDTNRWAEGRGLSLDAGPPS